MLKLFLLRIIGLVLFSNLYISLIGWDLLGITSFLLVVYYKNRKSLRSGLLTALSNRIGDCFFLCLLGFGSVDLQLTILLVTLLSITKRAQIPFSAWLPAAMAAPTPVSALVHSSTLVTAGVYIMLRYALCDADLLLAVGACTMLRAGVRACAESDLKKVVALRTLSQLGVMMISIGAQEKTFCFSHLIRHACFKALLFLCVGVCIHSVYGTQEFRRYNSILSSLFIRVFSTIANLSLIGYVFTAGFYRKDAILEALERKEINSGFILIFLLGVGTTACYTVKIQILLLKSFGQAGPRSTAIGGYRFFIKMPLLLLGSASVLFRSDNRLFVVLSPLDKGLPLIIIILGLLIGARIPGMNKPLLSGLFTVTPNTQSLALTTCAFTVPQQALDRGWLEIGSKTLSS